MATRPLPEAAAGPRFAAYIDELHELLATNRIAYGSPADLGPVVERLREPGPLADDLGSLVRSFILRHPVAGTEPADARGPIPVPPPNSSSQYFYNVPAAAMAAKLVFAPRPEVPLLARITHEEGPVTLQAWINRDGSVASARVVSGPHMLRGPAEEAVRRWRYLAYDVNGRPVDVATTGTVDFRDGGASALH